MIRVLIADKHAIVRGGLRHIIATTSDMVVVAEAAHGSEVIDKLRTCTVDLLLLDMTMPGISGIDLIRRLRAKQLPILVLCMLEGEQCASRALRAGATGYLTKDSDPGALLAAIRKLADGEKFTDPKLIDTMAFETNPADVQPHEVLSDREFQVLQMLAAGRSINEIAKAYVLSAKTISTHKMRLMRKLGLTNNAEIIRYAVQHALTPSEAVY
ncbi:response regulator transcription factor [Burkholderia sp. Ac-20345]|uniref:response regulator n=1 Tax=Burkholderia sp. Ac-20345 TaxID=2703891 RepID=UPI00197C7FB8|nr:response regulator transcription factor [Burkholderia sp. Ac-20345]MBN3779008.1 response regulator transcription factor [Burkholderia sp. Ac-20345]